MKICGQCYAKETIPDDKTIQEFKIVTADAEKVYVWCHTNRLSTFRNFIQYVLDGGKAEDFYVIEVKSGRVFKLLDLATKWGFRKRTFEEKLNDVQTGTLEMEEMKMKEIRNYIENTKANSAWKRGVKIYAEELFDQLKENVESGYVDPEDLHSPKLLHKALLNGADNWKQYSWGGCSLIYDSEIAERLCNPTELKKTRNGERRPNANEEWLDVQTRALHQADSLIKKAVVACG